MHDKPAAEQRSADKPEKSPVVKKPRWKLNVKEVGSQARVIQRTRERTELVKSEAMWWRPLLALAGAVVLIIAGSWTAGRERQKLRELTIRHDPFASIFSTTDGVLTQQGGSTIAATTGMQVCDGDIFLTGTNSETTIRYITESTVLTLGSNTFVALHQKNGKYIEVARGHMLADVAQQPESTNMVFMTPYAEVATTNARLDFRVTADFARIEMDAGEAQVRRSTERKATVVHTGEYAEATERSRLKTGTLPNMEIQNEQSPEQ